MIRDMFCFAYCMANNDYKSTVKRLGIPDEFVHHGTQEELHKEYLYDTPAIVKTVHEILAKKIYFLTNLDLVLR